MRVTLIPNGGDHEIVCDRIQLRSTAQVKQHIKYLMNIMDMLWPMDPIKTTMEKSDDADGANSEG